MAVGIPYRDKSKKQSVLRRINVLHGMVRRHDNKNELSETLVFLQRIYAEINTHNYSLDIDDVEFCNEIYRHVNVKK